MRSLFCRAVALLAMAIGVGSCTAQAPDNFRWVDFHSPNDQDVVNWVRRALEQQKWTAIREIGVEYDQALVITTNRNSAQGTPNREPLFCESFHVAVNFWPELTSCREYLADYGRSAGGCSNV